MTGRNDGEEPLPPEVAEAVARALDGAQAALAVVRAMPPGRLRGRAARDLGEGLRAIADKDAAQVLREEVQREYRERGTGLRPLARAFGISPALVQKHTAGVPRGKTPAGAGREDEEVSVPVVVAVVTSHLGALAGQVRGAVPPRWTFIRGDAEPGTTPDEAAVQVVGAVTGLAVRVVRSLDWVTGPGPDVIWLACHPATSDTEIGEIDSPDLSDVQWMGLGDVLRRMRGSLPPAVVAHLNRTLEA